MDGCKRVVAPISSGGSRSISLGAASTSVVSVVSDEEGSVRQGRSLTLARAALIGEITSCATRGQAGGESTRDAPLGTALTQLLCHPDR